MFGLQTDYSFSFSAFILFSSSKSTRIKKRPLCPHSLHSYMSGANHPETLVKGPTFADRQFGQILTFFGMRSLVNKKQFVYIGENFLKMRKYKILEVMRHKILEIKKRFPKIYFFRV